MVPVFMIPTTVSIETVPTDIKLIAVAACKKSAQKSRNNLFFYLIAEIYNPLMSSGPSKGGPIKGRASRIPDEHSYRPFVIVAAVLAGIAIYWYSRE